MSTPLYDAMMRYLSLERASFHTPGHKAHAPWLRFPADIPDLTELAETGSLYDGGDVIEQAEEEAARSFGAGKTFFSGGGCTLCIQTMLALGCRAGGRIVMGRNAHKSAVHTAALLDLDITWVTDVTPDEVDKALRKSGASAVYITSPTYFGALADVAGIADVCKRRGAMLLADNAHGSHLGAFSLHPLALGADMTADSAHKTLPVLTGGAYLHIRADGKAAHFEREYVKATMALFGSTSPSYVTLASLDLAQNWWREQGREAFLKLSEYTKEIKSSPFALPGGDPARVTLDMGALDGAQAAAWFRARGCEPETHDSRHVVFIPTPFNSGEEMERLRQAVFDLPDAPLPKRREETLFSAVPDGELPRRRMSLREAAFAPFETVPTACAAGRVAAQTIAPCPPGVAAVVSGEEISASLCERLSRAGVRTVRVVAEPAI